MPRTDATRRVRVGPSGVLRPFDKKAAPPCPNSRRALAASAAERGTLGGRAWSELRGVEGELHPRVRPRHPARAGGSARVQGPSRGDRRAAQPSRPARAGLAAQGARPPGGLPRAVRAVGARRPHGRHAQGPAAGPHPPRVGAAVSAARSPPPSRSSRRARTRPRARSGTGSRRSPTSTSARCTTTRGISARLAQTSSGPCSCARSPGPLTTSSSRPSSPSMPPTGAAATRPSPAEVRVAVAAPTPPVS